MSKIRFYPGVHGFKNLIINGDFSIWQRGTDISKSVERTYFGVDRFFIYQMDVFGTIRNVKSTEGNENICRVEVSGVNTSVATRRIGFVQRTEPVMYQPLIGQTITVSFYVRSNRSLLHVYAWHAYDPGTGITGTAIYENDIPITPDEWNRITYTYLFDHSTFHDPSITSVFVEFFACNIGTDSPVNDGDYVEFKQVQAEIGEAATEFERVPYDIQLMRCMRYYIKQEEIWFELAANWNNSFLIGNLMFPFPMRSIPAITAEAVQDTSGTPESNLVITAITPYSFHCYRYGTSSNCYIKTYEADAEIY